MNKPYDSMSDFEINKRVAELLGYRISKETYMEILFVNKPLGKYFLDCELFNACNNWSDIGPIIEEYHIDLTFSDIDSLESEAFAEHFTEDGKHIKSDWLHKSQIKRAAAIVFLQMKEGE